MSNEATPAKKLTLLQNAAVGTRAELYQHVILDNEEVLYEFNATRDVLVFTNKKMIAIDVQGLTGKKKEVLVLPYSKMTAFSTETAGTFDLDLEIKVWASGVGFIEFTFIKGTTQFQDITTLLATKIG